MVSTADLTCGQTYQFGKGERSALIECANTPSSPERCGIASVTSDRQVKQACSRIDLWQTLFAVAGHACHPISNGEFLMHPPIRKHCFQPGIEDLKIFTSICDGFEREIIKELDEEDLSNVKEKWCVVLLKTNDE
ncbi:Tudor domain-containing protein [Trichinella pseudospiralis]